MARHVADSVVSFFSCSHPQLQTLLRKQIVMRYDHTVGRENELCGSILEFLAETGICVIIMQNGVLGHVHFAHFVKNEMLSRRRSPSVVVVVE